MTIASSMFPDNIKLAHYLSAGIGMFFAGIGVTLYTHQIVNPQVFMAFWGVPLLLWAGAALVFSMPQSGMRSFYPVIAAVMAFIACVAALNTRSIRRYYWDEVEPEWNFIYNLETPRERMPVFFPAESPLHASPKVMFYRYGKDLWQMPRDTKTALSSIIPALLQAPEPKPSILVIAPPFSAIYNRLIELSKSDRIDILMPSGEMLEIAMMLKPPVNFFTANTNIFLHEPFRYLQQLGKTGTGGYDLIFMVDRFHDPLYRSDAFFETVRAALKPRGAFICSGLTPKETARMRKYFAKTLILSRDDNLMAAGSDNITTDHDELEKRFENISGNHQLPKGIFSIMFPHTVAGMKIATPEAPLNELLKKKSPDPIFPDWFLWSRSKDAGLIRVFKVIKPGMFLLPLIMVFYLIYRFMASRKNNHLLQFETVENGIFCGGFMLIMMMLYQLDTGSIYREAGILLGLFGGGVAAGIYLGGIYAHGRRLMQILGILLPLLVLFVWNDVESRGQWLFSATMLLTGASIAVTALDIDSRRTLLKAYSLNGFLFLGISIGIVLVTVLLFSGMPSYWSIGLVAAILLPRSFDRQLVGN